MHNKSVRALLSAMVVGALVVTPSSPALGANAACVVTEATSGIFKFVALKTASFSYCDWTLPAGLSSIDILVVAGGGGGGHRNGGGGGAGGFVEIQGFRPATSVLQLVVGPGGSGGNTFSGTSGSDSEVRSSTGVSLVKAVGGGGGATGNDSTTPGKAGGSAGGSTGASASSQPAAVTPPQGTAGGSGWASGLEASYGGGGGGADTAGVAATSTRAGAGGSGKSVSWINTTVAQALGVGATDSGTVYFAGGGGGGSSPSGLTAIGGRGGGGTGGRNTTAPTAGAANTGGGGGGGASYLTSTGGDHAAAPGNAGGSGVVVIRYSLASATPVISSQPQDSLEPVGGTAAFSVSASATPGNLTYQWQESATAGTWTNISGATSTSFSTQPVTTAMNGYRYRVVVTNTDGTLQPTSETSTAAVLAVRPVFTSSPQNATVVAGTSATFSAAAGAVTSYRWESATAGSSNWQTISGATSASYTTPVTSAAMNGLQYRVIAINNTISTNIAYETSTVATLTVVSKLGISTSASEAVAGAEFAVAPVIEVQDGSGARVSSSSATVTVAILGASFASGVTTSVTAVNGLATFSGLRINTAGKFTLTYSSGTLTSVSESITVSPASANKIVITQSASGAQAGAAFTVQPVVQIQDQYSNVETTTASVTVSVSGGASFSGGNTSVQTSNGTATFSNLQIDKAGTFTLTFASQGLIVATQTLTVTPAAASKLAIAVQAGDAAVGARFGNQPSVQISDAYGNVVTNSSALVTVSLSSGSFAPGSTLFVNAVNGVATFTNLQVNTAGTYILTFSSGSLVVDTQTIVVGSAAATKLHLLTPATASVTAGVVFAQQPVVELRDQFDARTDSTLVVTVAITGAQAPDFSVGVTKSVAAINGRATFVALKIDVAGTHTLTFSSGGLTVATQTVTIVPAAPSKLELIYVPQSIQAPNANNFQPKAVVADAFGNIVTTSTAVVRMTITSGPGTFVGGGLSETKTAVSGEAQFLTRITTVGIYGLKFESDGLTSALYPPLTVTSAPTAIEKSAGDNQSAAISSVPAILPKVRVVDAFGNAFANQSVTFAVASGGGTLASSAAVLTDASGYAIAPAWTLGSSTGTQTLTATWGTQPAVIFTVTAKAPQTITFGVLEPKTVGAADFSLTATASSNLTVTFTSTTLSVCTVTGTTVKILIAGQCSITADQAGDATYAPAESVVRAFTVSNPPAPSRPGGGGSTVVVPESPKEPTSTEVDPNWPGVTVDPVTPPKDPGKPGKPGSKEFDLSGLPKDARITPPAKDKLPKGVSEVVVAADGKVTVNAAQTFTGKVMVEIMVVVDGQAKPLLVPVTIDPLPATPAKNTPVAVNRSTVSWSPVVNAVKYELRVNGKVVCLSEKVTCAVPTLLGPNAKVELTTLGNDGTKSAPVTPTYVPAKPVTALAVTFGRSQVTLNAEAKKQLDALVKNLKEQGFTEVTLQALTDLPVASPKAKALTSKRTVVVRDYLKKFVTVKYVAAPPKQSATRKAVDRSVQVAVR